MAGYSGTPLVKKLGIRPGQRVAVLQPPAGFEDGLRPELPPGVSLLHRLTGHCDVVLLFATARRDLQRRLDAIGGAIAPAGAAWIAWPKKAARVVTDMTENVVRDEALPRGLVDVKVCAIDETWSGLKLVWRRERR